MRPARGEILQPDQAQHVGDAAGDLVPRQAFLLETERHVGLHRQMREQRIALKHHVDRTPVRRHPREIDAVEQDATGIRPLEPGDQTQQRGLAAARGAEQREEFAVVNVEGELVERDEVAEPLGDAFDAQQRTRRALG